MTTDTAEFGEYPWLRLGDVVDRAARLWPDRPAFIWNNGATTYRELAADVDRTAKALMAAGVKSGEHVAVWLTNRPEWLHLMFAIPKIGGCIVPLNTRYRTDDVTYTARQSESVLLVAAERSGPVDYAAMLSEARGQIESEGHLRQIVMLSSEDAITSLAESTRWDDFLAAGSSVGDNELDARASAVVHTQRMVLAYTSGTTGAPKGVVHSHVPIRNSRERMMLVGNTSNDVHLSYLPLFHLLGFCEIALQCALSGACQILMETFDAEHALDQMERHGGTALHGFDTHWSDLIRAQEANPRDTSSLRTGTLFAGMDSSTPIARLAQELFCPTVSGFGMSEVWALISVSHPTDSLEQRTEASGYPMDGIEYRIVDPDTGTEQPIGVPGQLLVRGYTVTEGYWRNPEATADTMRDGWFDSGDMARMRPDGHLVFMGRYKDMLKVGGENVSPAEIEAYLSQNESVAEIAVVSYPDPRLAEVPIAYVVAADGHEVDGDALIEQCRGRIASFKIPRRILVIDELPMTPSGKVRKVELRTKAIEDLGDPLHG